MVRPLQGRRRADADGQGRQRQSARLRCEGQRDADRLQEDAQHRRRRRLQGPVHRHRVRGRQPQRARGHKATKALLERTLAALIAAIMSSSCSLPAPSCWRRPRSSNRQGGASPRRPELAPGTKYDPGIPTLGRSSDTSRARASRRPNQITLYLKALAAAAPERTRLVEYARTWEGRPLDVLVIGSPERIAQARRR